jgi:uncharacterized protein (TIGR03086 family)
VDTYEAFERAVRSAETIVKGIAADQMDDPTPCTEWDVRTLLNHVVGTLWLHEALLDHKTPRYPMGPGQTPADDVVGADPVAAYQAGAEAALAAMRRPGALTTVHPTPLGDMPGDVLGSSTALDVYVHAWDLARATGQDGAVFDPELAEHLLGFARQAVSDESRGALIGPAVGAPADAPALDQLVAFFGRTP